MTMLNFDAITCTHEDMIECCDGCGHFNCPCGITCDEAFEGGSYDDPYDLLIDPTPRGGFND